MRKTEFANEEYYHIYNRGVDKREIFKDEEDLARFIRSMREFNCLEAIGSLYERDYQLKMINKQRKERGEKAMKLVDLEKEIRNRRSMVGQKEVRPPRGGQTSGSLISESDKLVSIIAYCLNSNHYHFILQQKVENGISRFMQKLSTAYTMYFNRRYKRSGSLFQGSFKAILIQNNNYLLYLSAYVNCNVEVHRIASADDYQWSSFFDYFGKRQGTLCDKEAVLGQFGGDYGDFAVGNARKMKEDRRFRDMVLD